MEKLHDAEEILTEIYCDIDDFCKGFKEYWNKHLIIDDRPIIPKCAMSLSEIMTITVYFHISNKKTFKWYYKNFICGYVKHLFPRRLSYN